MISKKGKFASSLLLLSGLLLGSCSTNPSSNPTTDGTNPGGDSPLSGNIIVWWPGGSSASEKAIKDAKAKYEEAHPGVTIDIRFQSTADFYLSYNMALLGNEYPDIAYIDHVYVQRLAHDGSIANLSDYNLDENKDKFIDSVWAPNLFNDDLYALPMSANVLTRVYNKALLSKVLEKEITEDDLPTNWEEYIQIGDKIKEYNTANELKGNDELFLTTVPAGTGAESVGAMYYIGMTAREGGSIMNEDFSEMTLTSQPNFEAATKIQQLGQGRYTPLNWSESKFETGKVAFIEMGPWKILDYSRMEDGETIDFEYSTIMPNITSGDTSSVLGLYSLVLTRKSKNHALATDFMKYLSTDKTIQLEHNSSQYLMPTTKEAISDEYYTTPEWQIFVEQLNNVVARPGSAAWPAIEKETAAFVTGLVNGERNPDYLYSLQAALEEKLLDLEE